MNAPAKTETKQGIVVWAAQEYGIEAGKVLTVLKTTCFRPSKAGEEPPSDAEVAALMIVARAHGLNPFLRQIYAFKDKRGGIVPVVGVDGWAGLVNNHPEFDGVEFEYGYDDKKQIESVTCIMYRKGKAKPTKITEFYDECRRDTEPWRQAKRRMLRHKAYIQCARVAFSFSGIYDDDEAARIIEGVTTEVPLQVGELIQREVDEPAETDPALKPSATAALASELAGKAAGPAPATDAWKTPSEIRKLLAEAAGNVNGLTDILAHISPLPDTPERAQLMREWNAAIAATKGDGAEPAAKPIGNLVDEPKKSA